MSKSIHYLGRGTRAISVEDLALVGLTAPRPLVWDRANNWRLPTRGLSPQLIHYLLATREFALGGSRA